MLDTKWTTQLVGHWVGESSLSIDLVYCGHQEAGRHVYVKSFHTWPSGGGGGGGSVTFIVWWKIGGYFHKHRNDRATSHHQTGG